MIDRNKHFSVRHFGGHWSIGHWPRLEAIARYIRSLVLLNSPASIIRQLLIDNGIQWPVYISHLPNVEEDAICVYDTGDYVDDYMISHKGISFVLRAKSYLVGISKFAEILSLLNSLHNQQLTVTSNIYEISNATLLDVEFLGYDVQRRNRLFSGYKIGIVRLVQQ